MKPTLLALALMVAVAPLPAQAVVLTTSAPSVCAPDPNGIIDMGCTRTPSQLQTTRLTLIRSLMPMNCRTTGVRFQIGQLPFSPGKAAGLIATAIIRTPTKSVHIEQMCQPSRW